MIDERSLLLAAIQKELPRVGLQQLSSSFAVKHASPVDLTLSPTNSGLNMT
jgi:hypothetical protein